MDLLEQAVRVLRCQLDNTVSGDNGNLLISAGAGMNVFLLLTELNLAKETFKGNTAEISTRTLGLFQGD